jgi:hypothetical protein
VDPIASAVRLCYGRSRWPSGGQMEHGRGVANDLAEGSRLAVNRSECGRSVARLNAMVQD